ncbi:aurora kinase B-like [Sitodiplosis mosellana]|uniref:aurora kinase B-like n=1 Tax=Sitodiplosis mosellana TaxID=263140 RepID=UPI0024448079|nr:aurora kinase B-like [Sitodiplosis mosellana]
MAKSKEFDKKAYAAEIEGEMQEHEAYGDPDYKWSTDDFELGAALGRGKFGRVFVAREKKTHYMVAMKVLFKSEIMKGRCERQIAHEIEIQSRLRHPNILRLYTWFYDERRIYLALELATEGELYRHLQMSPNGRFSEARSGRYTYQVAAALHYCHLSNVIHRDLKPENLLLSVDDQVKLSDFGWSVHTTSSARKTMCGTLDYLPPEMVDGQTYDDSVDQWCLGILCYEFLVGKPPFESNEQQATYEKIRALDIEYPSYVSIGAKDLVSGLLRKRGRSTLVEVMQHPWVKLYKDCDWKRK